MWSNPKLSENFRKRGAHRIKDNFKGYLNPLSTAGQILVSARLSDFRQLSEDIQVYKIILGLNYQINSSVQSLRKDSLLEFAFLFKLHDGFQTLCCAVRYNPATFPCIEREASLKNKKKLWISRY